MFVEKVKVIKCDFNNPDHCNAEINLMRDYMTDSMGGRMPFNAEENRELIKGLKNHPTLITLLINYNNEFVGLSNSFINFSTFAAKSFLNIHDVIIKSDFRGKGLGKILLNENIRIAKEELNCSKITLEVRDDNAVAQNLYKSLGFNNCIPKMYFWEKHLLTL